MEGRLPFEQTVIVGLGGITTHLYVPLGELLVHSEVLPKSVMLIDGDDFSERNLGRQGISRQDLGKKKAEVYAQRMGRRFPDLSVRSYPEFLVPKNVEEFIPQGSIVFAAVDNHATRLLISKRIQTFKDTLLVSGGNEIWDGNAQIYVKADGRPRTKPIEAVHSEIAEPKDKNPGEMSCEERLAMPGGEQVLATNMMVAAYMVALFQDVVGTWPDWSNGKEVRKVGEVMFDTREYIAAGYVRSV